MKFSRQVDSLRTRQPLVPMHRDESKSSRNEGMGNYLYIYLLLVVRLPYRFEKRSISFLPITSGESTFFFFKSFIHLYSFPYSDAKEEWGGGPLQPEDDGGLGR